MPALHQYGCRAKRSDDLTGRFHVLNARDLHLCQCFSLGYIRGHNSSARNKTAAKGIHRVWFQQRMAALGEHNRICNEREVGCDIRQYIDNRLNHRGAMQHARFQTIRTNIVEHQAHLLFDEIGFNRDNTVNTGCILRRQRGDCGHRKSAKRRHRFDIRLNPGAPTGIRAGND